MSSGVAVDDECKNVFEEIKKNKKHRYIVFYIKDEKSIAVETIGGRDASYDSFLTDLMKNGESECRYGLYDMEYEHQCQGATEVSKKQTLPHGLVSRHSQDQEENVVLIKLRCTQEITRWSP